MSLRVLNTDRPDAWEVQGRGELQLAVLVEMMRREGFELTVGKPEVVTRVVDGKLHEPVEHVTIDVPEEFVGNVTTLLATRKGTMTDMVNHGTGWVRLEWRIPARGLVGIRTEFMTETRGAGTSAALELDGYAPWFGDIRLRQNGVLVADRRGDTTGNALLDLEQRGTLFVGPGVEVYEGMIAGENSRSDEMNAQSRRKRRSSPTCARRAATTRNGSPCRRSSRWNRHWNSLPTTRPSKSPRSRCACAKRCLTLPRVTDFIRRNSRPVVLSPEG